MFTTNINNSPACTRRKCCCGYQLQTSECQPEVIILSPLTTHYLQIVYVTDLAKLYVREATPFVLPLTKYQRATAGKRDASAAFPNAVSLTHKCVYGNIYAFARVSASMAINRLKRFYHNVDHKLFHHTNFHI